MHVIHSCIYVHFSCRNNTSVHTAKIPVVPGGLPASEKREIDAMERQINILWAVQYRSHEDHTAICIVLPGCRAICIVLSMLFVLLH